MSFITRHHELMLWPQCPWKNLVPAELEIRRGYGSLGPTISIGEPWNPVSNPNPLKVSFVEKGFEPTEGLGPLLARLGYEVVSPKAVSNG